MEAIKLDVQTRKEIGTRNIKALRAKDFIPGIVYGMDEDATAIKLEKRSYEKIKRAHKGQSLVFQLNILEDEKTLGEFATIVKEEQLNPVTDRLVHIDFKRISLTEEIEVVIPVVAKGEPAGVKSEGGSLDHLIWELDVFCMPMSIPEKIEIDVSHLKVGDAIHVKDIIFPANVKTHHDPETVVFSVVPPRKEEEELEATEPEVTKEKKSKE